MSDLAIQALITGGSVIGVAVIVLYLALKLSSAKDDSQRYSTQLVAAQKDGDAKSLVITSLTTDLKTANARVEALDAENQKLRAAMPVDGSYQRLLSSAAAQATSGGAGGAVVPDGKPAAPSGIDELLDPAKA